MNKDTFVKKNEGMWLPNKLPLKQFKKYYKFTPDEDWGERVQKSCVRMNNGGSASFVSPDGLIVTNHHVAESILHDLSSAKKDYLKDGFYAKTHKEELKAPKLEVNVLWEIEDVTDRVTEAVEAKKSPAAKTEARKAEIAAIEKESLEETSLRSDVVTLYQGGAYHLYRYKKYTDIRVVFAPEAAIAGFGGDFDNYEYPRYCLDATFFRVYENNKPVQTDYFFKWNTANSKMGELTFVAGHPGTTYRLTTAARIKYLRDVGLPRWMNILHRWEISMQQYGGKSPEHERQAKNDLHSWQNVRKRWQAEIDVLQDPEFMNDIVEREEYVRSLIRKDPKLKAYDSAWDDIEKTQKVMMKIRDELGFFEHGRGFDTTYFKFARMLVRMHDEDKKKNGERLPEYAEARRPQLLQNLHSTQPIYPELEEFKLKDSLSFLLETFGDEDKDVQKILDGKSPTARAREMVKQTKLGNVNFRKKLLKEGKKEVQASKDPFITLVKLIDDRSRTVRKIYEEKIAHVEEEAYGKIARALFELFGEAVYPDATFTLRVAYAPITKYGYEKVNEQDWTTIGGVFDHAEKHERSGYWTLPQSWLKKEAVLKKDTATFNFITGHDTHGGNSGSPVFDRDLNITGLLFDGMLHSQGDAYDYMSIPDHSLSVHSAGIYSVLKKVYNAKRLVSELDAARKAKRK